MLTPSLPTESTAGLSAAARRRIQAGMLVRSAAGVPRVGVLPWTTDPIVTGTTDLAMTYQIAPFVAATARNSAGIEWVANDATETVSTTVAPGSNSRIDVIWVRCRFPLAGDTPTSPEFGVTQGTANASPTKPSIPAGALELATAVVTSSDLATQTVVITQTYPFTAMAGGTVWLRSKAEQDAWEPPNGTSAFRLDTQTQAVRVGGKWGVEFIPTVAPASGVTLDAATVVYRNTQRVITGYIGASVPGSTPWSVEGLVGTIPDGCRPEVSASFTHRSWNNDGTFTSVSNIGRVDPNGEIWVNLLRIPNQIIARGPFTYRAKELA